MKRLLFLSISFLLTGKLIAQDQPDVKHNDRPSVVTYNAEEPKEKPEVKNTYLIKLNLISALSGDIGPSIEKPLFNKFTGEVGAGVTVKNFSKDVLIDFFEINDGSNNQSILRESKLGGSFMAAFKYYPEEAMDEYYFAPEFRYRRYNSTSRVENQRGNFDESSSLTDFKLTFGYVDYVDDFIIVEFNAGVGIRNRNESLLAPKKDSAGNQTGIFALENTNKMVPLVSLGLKIGFLAKK